jgi:predicted O-methyltransferase YrrM
MTTRELTPLLAIAPKTGTPARSFAETLFQLGFAAVQWPWLLRSLYGGTQASKRKLLQRLALAPDTLPHLGSWKADTYLLHRLVDLIEAHRPKTVVELGSGATTLVLGRALEMFAPGARLVSYDQNAEFVTSVQRWLGDNGLAAELRHASLSSRSDNWPGLWYQLDEVPGVIDMLVIDGPPWSVHPFVRGAAETLFSRLSRGGLVVLDDAARPGERIVARRWKRSWPDIHFEFDNRGNKGTLIGRKL